MRVLAHIKQDDGDGGISVVTADEVTVMGLSGSIIAGYMDAIGREDYDALTEVLYERIRDTLDVLELGNMMQAVHQAVSPGPGFIVAKEFAIDVKPKTTAARKQPASVYVLVNQDHNGQITHLEVFSQSPRFALGEHQSLFAANIDGGDSLDIS